MKKIDLLPKFNGKEESKLMIGRLGEISFQCGKSINTNPYSRATDGAEHYLWAGGWNDAKNPLTMPY